MSEPPARAPAKRSLARTAIRLLGPVLLVIVLWRLDDPAALYRSVRDANLPLLLAATLLNPLNIHLKVVRWRVMLKHRGIHYPLKRAWLAFLTGAYLAMLTPGRVGDILRVQYLKRDLDVSYPEGLASVVMDRFCDLYVLAAFVGVAAVHFGPVLAPELAWATWLCVAGTVLLPLASLLPGLPEKVLGRVFRTVGARFGGLEGGFQRFFTALRANFGWSLTITLPLTTLAFIVNYVQGAMIARAMGIDITFFDVTCLLAIASLLGLLPISLSGVGIREAFFAVIFPALALTAEQGVSFGLLVFAIIYIAITIAGFIAWQIAPPPIGAGAGDDHRRLVP